MKGDLLKIVMMILVAGKKDLNIHQQKSDKKYLSVTASGHPHP